MTTANKIKNGIINAIRLVLLSEWDPLCIGDNPMLRDEYDRYISKIYRLVIGNAKEDTIAAELKDIETKEIGIDRDMSGANAAEKR